MSECEYEGCNEPALRDSEYCIFHKPNKNEEEAREFYERIREEAEERSNLNGCSSYIFKSKMNFRGYYFPGIPEREELSRLIFTFKGSEFREEADFFAACFEKTCNFEGSRFCKTANFKQVLCKDECIFKNVIFEEDANFEGLSATRDSDFEEVTFKGDAIFRDGVYKGDSRFRYTNFEGGTNYEEAKFKRFVDFGSATFREDVSFENTHFEMATRFKDAQIMADASFKGAKFCKSAHFTESTFEKNARFNSTKFHSFVDFTEARFDREADFDSVKFHGDAFFPSAEFKDDMNFKYAKFKGDALFKRSTVLGDCYFSNAIFSQDLNLTSAHFQGRVEFIDDLEELNRGVNLVALNPSKALKIISNLVSPFRELEIEYSDTTTQTFFCRDTAKNILEQERESEKEIVVVKTFVEKFVQPEAKAEGCREQRLTYESKGKKEEADQVYVHEMRARREAKDSRQQQFIDWLIADWTCKYGTSWQKVIGNSLGIMAVAGLLFWTCNILTVKFGSLWPWVGVFKSPEVLINEAISLRPWGFFEGLGDSLYYSVITFTTLGFGDLHPAGLTMKLLSGIESALGALFVALIIVVFARKWMRG